MAKTVVIDELHLTLRVPVDLPDADANAVRRTLLGAEFMDRLRQAVLSAVLVFPELAPCRLALTR
jgi:hypothetical protein